MDCIKSISSNTLNFVLFQQKSPFTMKFIITCCLLAAFATVISSYDPCDLYYLASAASTNKGGIPTIGTCADVSVLEATYSTGMTYSAQLCSCMAGLPANYDFNFCNTRPSNPICVKAKQYNCLNKIKIKTCCPVTIPTLPTPAPSTPTTTVYG